jgi:hypothetical protein
LVSPALAADLELSAFDGDAAGCGDALDGA